MGRGVLAVRRYVIGLALLALALCLRVGLGPWLGESLSHPTIFISVLLAAWFLGNGPAVVIIILAYPLVNYFVLDVRTLHPPSYLMASLFLYLTLNAVILIFVSTLRRQTQAAAEREKNLKDAQALAHLGSWDLDLTTNRLTWSDEVYRIFGLTQQEFNPSYEAFLNAVHPDDRDAVDLAYGSSIREGRDSYEIEHRIIKQDTRDVRTVHEKCEHIRDSSGRIVRSVGMVHDITDLKRTQEELSAIYNNAPLILMLVDSDVRIRKVNKFAAEKFGFGLTEQQSLPPLAKALGCISASESKDGCGSLPQCAACTVRQAIMETLETGRPHEQKEVQLPLPKQEHAPARFFLISTSRLAVQGEPSALVTLLDISERKEAEDALRRQAALIDLSPAGIITRTEEGTIRFWSKGAETLYGWTPSDVLGRNVHELLRTEFPEPVGVILERIRKGDTWTGELVHQAKDGRKIIVQSFWHADRSGTELLVLESNVDITERKQVEQRLKQSQARLRATFDRAGVGIVEAEGPDRLVAANRRACEILGYSQEELLGMTVHDLTYPEDRLASDEMNAKIHAGTQDRISYEKRYLKKDGSPLWVNVTVTAVRNAEGDWLRSIATVEDISDRKRAEGELESAMASLRDADRRKDEFLAMLAHELRNPMAAISMAATLLSLPQVPDDQAVFAKKSLIERVRQLSRLIDDLLDVSRIATGKIDLKKKRVDLSAVIDSAIEITRKQFEDGEQQLNVRVVEPLAVIGDSIRLEQAITNLLSNASKYMAKGGIATVTAFRDGAHGVIQIKDNGIGITADILPHVFELFRQADTSLHRTGGGLGIGLTVAKKVVELHGGTISAQSGGLGKGSEFEIRLPLSEDAQGEHEERRGIRVKPGLHILIIEDNEDTALATAGILELDGHRTDVRLDGDSGLEAALESKPDVILLDIGLPGLNGYEVAAEIRAKGLTDIVIIAVSGYGQPNDIEVSRASGIDEHMLKPLDYQELQNRLHDSLQRKQLLH